MLYNGVWDMYIICSCLEILSDNFSDNLCNPAFLFILITVNVMPFLVIEKKWGH